MKKISLVSVLLVLLMAGCASPKSPVQQDISKNSGGTTNLTATGGSDYVDTLTTDPDGFVRFPGEPTRHSDKYYIVEDICGQFTAKFMEGATGQKIIKAENPYANSGSVYTCEYTSEGNTSPDIMLVLDYLEFANQKTGQEAMGRRTEESSAIPMRNMVVYQPDGQINEIYLVLSDNKFLSLNRGAGTKVSNDEELAIATKIAQKIKNYL
jgi:hypothetical protein